MYHPNIERSGADAHLVVLDCEDLPKASGPSEELEMAEWLRRQSLCVIIASIAIAALLATEVEIDVDVLSAAPFLQLIAAGILASTIAATRQPLTRIGDALGSAASIILSGMVCGFISLMGLRLHFPRLDDRLFAADRMLGLNDAAFVAWLSHASSLLHGLMSFSYNTTVPILLASLIVQAWRRERTEVWRAVFCFTGSLVTVCTSSILTPAKGLGLWIADADLARLPGGAARYFWPAFDRYYEGTASQIRIESIGAVVSFPSFHAVMGLIVLMIWRKQPLTFALAVAWLMVMLPAAVALGGHYFVDLLGGFAIWITWFALSRRPRPRSRCATIAFDEHLCEAE